MLRTRHQCPRCSIRSLETMRSTVFQLYPAASLFLAMAPLVMAIGIDIYCPKSYVDGKKLFVCKINRTAIQNANCLSVEKLVKFNFNFKFSFRSALLCQIEYDSPDICSSKSDLDMCWCEVSGDIFTYKLLLPNTTLDGSDDNNNGEMECEVCMYPMSKLNRTSSSGCTNAFKAWPIVVGNSGAPFAYGIIILLIPIVSYTILVK